ncbi:MAG TPA: hypothetical protein VHU41_20165, partial [Thermoanaerobaculia bacterium]|nr:hypothetical protein [Thermoanaerobaculia bacterium]
TQTVLATLVALDLPGYVPGQPSIIYNAHLSTDRNVAYHPGACADLAGVTTVQDAIDKLCKRPTGGGQCSIVLNPGDDIVKRLQEVAADRDVEICFRAGEFTIGDPVLIRDKRSVKVTGAGDGTRITAKEALALRFERCTSVIVRDLLINGGSGNEGNENPAGVVSCVGCDNVSLDQLRVSCAGRDGEGTRRACIVISDSRDITIHRCNLVAGVEQKGLHVYRPRRAVIEENRVTGIPASATVINGIARDELVKNTRITPAGAPGGPAAPDALSIHIGNQFAFLTNHQEVTQDLQALVNEVDTSNVKDEPAARQVLTDVVDRAIKDPAVQDRLTSLGQLIQHFAVSANRIAVAIDVLGTPGMNSIGSLVIRDNQIVQAGLGVRAGFSANDKKFDHTERAAISGNEIATLVSATENDPSMGIHVASCDSLHVFGNRITGDIARNQNVGIDVRGDLGIFAIIRDNEVEGSEYGIRADATNAAPPVIQWRIVSNIVAGTATPYTPPPATPGPWVFENNRP